MHVHTYIHMHRWTFETGFIRLTLSKFNLKISCYQPLQYCPKCWYVQLFGRWVKHRFIWKTEQKIPSNIFPITSWSIQTPLFCCQERQLACKNRIKAIHKSFHRHTVILIPLNIHWSAGKNKNQVCLCIYYETVEIISYLFGNDCNTHCHSAKLKQQQ